MASNFKRGGSLLIPFRNGWSITDSQGRPRIYKTMQRFEKAFPKHYLGIDGVELVEYAEVRHGMWVEYDVREYADGICIPDYKCSECGRYECIKLPYCPNCGAKMNEEQKGAE